MKHNCLQDLAKVSGKVVFLIRDTGFNGRWLFFYFSHKTQDLFMLGVYIAAKGDPW